MRLTFINHSIFVQITFNSLDHFDLLALFIECDGMGVAGSKENLEHLEGVSIECIPRNLSLAVQVSVLQCLLTVAVKSFSQLGS